jgi:signal transduction histidine kinase
MAIAVNDTTQALSILIMSHDAELAREITSYLNQGMYYVQIMCSEGSVDETLKQYAPHVVISCGDDCSQVKVIHEAVASRSVLIIVNDDPPSEYFQFSDQVIPTSFLPNIEPVIQALLKKARHTEQQAKQNDELERRCWQLQVDLVDANQNHAEINLLKQAIVHSVSHELRTPMLQVKSAVALLSEDVNTNTAIVELAMEATTRLEGRIRNITLLNELMIDKSDAASFTAVPIVQLIQAAIRNIGRSWEHKKDVSRIELHSEQDDCAVLCDKQRLVTAIQLILDNALKFSQDKVTAEFTVAGQRVTVKIHDRGIGIPPDKLDHILEPFYQIDGSSTRRFGGMGVGLAIVQMILEQHCSTIRVDSTQGQGSCFGFELDILAVEQLDRG